MESFILEFSKAETNPPLRLPHGGDCLQVHTLALHSLRVLYMALQHVQRLPSPLPSGLVSSV